MQPPRREMKPPPMTTTAAFGTNSAFSAATSVLVRMTWTPAIFSVPASCLACDPVAITSASKKRFFFINFDDRRRQVEPRRRVAKPDIDVEFGQLLAVGEGDLVERLLTRQYLLRKRRSVVGEGAPQRRTIVRFPYGRDGATPRHI